MKLLMEVLRVWNRETFGMVDLNIENCVKELNEIENLWAADL
ncbi:hypothetical protein A2U01_0038193, partial [Trifolium medium]|nr:hypothetical protein [Trifolium medium]